MSAGRTEHVPLHGRAGLICFVFVPTGRRAPMNAVQSNDFPERLNQRLGQPLPGRAAQRAFAHELSYGRHHGPPRFDTTPAAVITLLCHENESLYVPLMLRPDSMRDHAGQICLPGGIVEAGESHQQCAVRELHEELGVPNDQVEIVGQLSPIVVYATSFEITPIVAYAAQGPDFAVNSVEVAELIRLPIDVLFDDTASNQMEIRKGPIRFMAPYFGYGHHQIWGATSLILAELSQVVRDCVD